MFKVFKIFICCLASDHVLVIVPVLLKSNYRAAHIEINNSLHAKYRNHWKVYLAETDRKEGEETFICARQSGVGSNFEERGPYHADVQAEFVELITEYCEQVEDFHVSGTGTGSSTFSTDAIGRPEWRWIITRFAIMSRRPCYGHPGDFNSRLKRRTRLVQLQRNQTVYCDSDCGKTCRVELHVIDIKIIFCHIFI